MVDVRTNERTNERTDIIQRRTDGRPFSRTDVLTLEFLLDILQVQYTIYNVANKTKCSQYAPRLLRIKLYF